MSWSRGDAGSGRRGYHHGNLREALIRAALDLIAEKGPAGFTFADAARSAGVARRLLTGIFAIAKHCSSMSRAATSSFLKSA